MHEVEKITDCVIGLTSELQQTYIEDTVCMLASNWKALNQREDFGDVNSLNLCIYIQI